MTLTPHSGAVRFACYASVVAIIAALVLASGLGGPFTLDDAQTIVNNSLIRIAHLDRPSLELAASSFAAGGGSRPLPMLSFALDYWRQGSLDPASFKATNLLIHAFTTIALAFFFRRLLTLAQWPPRRAATWALALALLWAIHPLQVSSVLYVVQRMQTMATLFIVLAMWAYLGLRRAQLQGRHGWPHGLLAALCWLLALLSKEDAVLLPAYTLAMELTVLQFGAADPKRVRALRNTYIGLTIAGTAMLVLWAFPHYWSATAYDGRGFHSIERLLTQGRVLVMYMVQIVAPLPRLMLFNYDNIVVSRSLLNPLTTVPALLLLVALLVWAWRWRMHRPLFALGVLLFFSGHFLTSNIISLELAFEHRNHFPLIGAVLAVGALFAAACQRWQLSPRLVGGVALLSVVALGAACVMRAQAWGDPVRFAKYHTSINPQSARAWLTLGGTYFDLSKKRPGGPYLDLAIQAAQQGAARTGSASAYSNVVIYKTIQRTVTSDDWEHLVDRLVHGPMLSPDKNTLWTMITNTRRHIGLDQRQVLRVIAVITARSPPTADGYLRIGAFIYKDTQYPEQAREYFLRAAALSPANDPSIAQLRRILTEQGKSTWAEELKTNSAHLQPAPSQPAAAAAK